MTSCAANRTIATFSSPRHSANCRNQFLDLVPLLENITGREGSRDTMGHMIPQNLLFNLMKCGPDCIDLGQDIHAITIFFHHPH